MAHQAEDRSDQVDKARAWSRPARSGYGISSATGSLIPESSVASFMPKEAAS